MKDLSLRHEFSEFQREAETLREELEALSADLYEHPELSACEWESSKKHMALLASHGFMCTPVHEEGLETAFFARYDSGNPGPAVAFMAEYDALPAVGHGCGHNLLGATSTGAAILLSRFVGTTGGSVVLVGTPAEETYGGKVLMVEHNMFDGLDVGIMAHPSNVNKISGTSLAFHAIEVTFTGKAAHAAADPEKGLNALSAMELTFMGLHALREVVPDDVRLHGIITHGGDAPNIIPDSVTGRFYVRAGRKTTANTVRERFYRIIEGAELMTGCRAEYHSFERSFDDMNTNPVLNDLCTRHMEEAGLTPISRDTAFKASIDMGNVSYVIPAIHSYFDITGGADMAQHSLEFAAATMTDYAKDQMMKMVIALARTGCDVLTEPQVLESIRAAFKTSLEGLS